MNAWNQIPKQEHILLTMKALQENGISSVLVDTGAEAKAKVLELIPDGSEVMTMSSVTLETIGIENEINGSEKYNAVKPKLYSLDSKTQKREQKKLGSSPEYSVGSVHAVTQDGKVIIASNTGSQLPGYSYGSDHVIWVVGAQKIVKNLDDGMARLEEHVVPLEAKHMQEKYNLPGTFVSKLLIVNRETVPGRITLIFVKEALGY